MPAAALALPCEHAASLRRRALRDDPEWQAPRRIPSSRGREEGATSS